MPQLVKISMKLGARGLDVDHGIGPTNSDKEAAASKLLNVQNSVAPPLLFISKSRRRRQVRQPGGPEMVMSELPAMFLYDRSGKRVRSVSGGRRP